MISQTQGFIILLCFVLLTSCAWNTTSSPDNISDPSETKLIPDSTTTIFPETNPAELTQIDLSRYSVSIDRMFSFLTELTNIQVGAGFRTSGTDGELEALLYVKSEMQDLVFLQQIGSEFELQEFPIYITTEIHQSKLRITANSNVFNYSADAIRGWLNRPSDAIPLDSDGNLNDSNSDPVIVSGDAVMILSLSDFQDISILQYDKKVVFLSYALIDKTADATNYWDIIETVFNSNPKAVVLITENSNQAGESHGSFANEEGPYSDLPVPVIQIRLEDLKSAGIEELDDLRQITNAEVTWDADVLSPAQSHNLIMHVPGVNPDRALIISAHIDSVGNPGAMDDGSGSVILMEIAHVLNEHNIQPPNDLYLVWYGSEELGLYGSSHFVNTHSELLDRTIANLQIDCLTRPMNGTQAYVQFAFWPFDGTDLESSRWVNTMQSIAADLGIEAHKMVLDMASDNGVMDGFNVPNFDLIYSSDDEMESIGGIWYGGHIHDPYDDVNTARDVSGAFEQMGDIALQAALLPSDIPVMRSFEPSGKRIVIIASKNESPQTFPINLREFGMVMAQAGFDLDVIPFGKSYEMNDLSESSAVLVLPSVDYAGESNAVTSYDVSWREGEIALLEHYVADGGLLILANSQAVWGFYDYGMDENEDWLDMNDIGERFGITFDAYLPYSSYQKVMSEHSLTSGLSELTIGSNYSVPFIMNDSTLLAGKQTAMTAGIKTISTNGGEVLVLSDLSILSRGWDDLLNREFIANLAQYILQR